MAQYVREITNTGDLAVERDRSSALADVGAAEPNR